MPFCGAMFDENSVPPLDKGGLQGGFEHGDQATPAQRATPPKEGFFRRDTELTAEFEIWSPAGSISDLPTVRPLTPGPSPALGRGELKSIEFLRSSD
jgi:hypothetical protein